VQVRQREQGHDDPARRDHGLGTSRDPLPSRTKCFDHCRARRLILEPAIESGTALNRHLVNRDEPAGEPVGGDILGDAAGEFRIDVHHLSEQKLSRSLQAVVEDCVIGG
jgi:hypothetical protein